VKTADVCRKHGIGSATFFKWKSEYTWFGPQSPEPTVLNFKIQAD
jgi:transposase-like protein